MKCCNPFKNLIAYVDDQLLQPSMLQKIYKLSDEWEDLEARVKKLEDGEDIPDNIQQQINQLKIQVQALNNSLFNKLDIDTFNVFQTNVEESITTLETDVSALKTKTNSLEQELNTQSHLIMQAQQTATSAQNTANTADTNAMDALTGLDGKANADASNLTDADVTAWQSKIGSGGGGDLTEYAKRDASNLTNENSDAWVDKLGVNNKVETTEFNQYKALINVNKADSDAGNLSVADIQAWQEKLGVENIIKTIELETQQIPSFLQNNPNVLFVEVIDTFTYTGENYWNFNGSAWSYQNSTSTVITIPSGRIFYHYIGNNFFDTTFSILFQEKGPTKHFAEINRRYQVNLATSSSIRIAYSSTKSIDNTIKFKLYYI